MLRSIEKEIIAIKERGEEKEDEEVGEQKNRTSSDTAYTKCRECVRILHRAATSIIVTLYRSVTLRGFASCVI